MYQRDHNIWSRHIFPKKRLKTREFPLKNIAAENKQKIDGIILAEENE